MKREQNTDELEKLPQGGCVVVNETRECPQDGVQCAEPLADSGPPGALFYRQKSIIVLTGQLYHIRQVMVGRAGKGELFQSKIKDWPFIVD